MNTKQQIVQKKIKALPHFYVLLNSDKRYIMFRGGTRSGKTVSIFLYLFNIITKYQDISIVVGVESLQAARGNLLKDFHEWIQIFSLYPKLKINLANHTYTHLETNSTIYFVPCDKDTKWFGLKADIFWFNEAPHIPKKIFEQAQMRLPDRDDFKCKIILDYNPTNPYSWVRELENSNPPGGVELHTSTFYDNPFIGPDQRKLYESFKETNYNKWLIYGKGEWAEIRGAVFKNWETVDEFPDCKTFWYGLDWGYANDPTALIKVGIQGGQIYLEEKIYEVALTNPDIANRMAEIGIGKRDEIIADSAEPKSIEEIKRFGYFIRPAKKGPDSVLLGLDVLLRYKINIVKNSKRLIDEFINYTWMERDGKFMNRPVDDWNHGIDAVRYVALNKLNKKATGGIKIR